MLEYQLFLFNAAERLVNGHPTTCMSDDEAMDIANYWLGHFPSVEVWHLGRLVGRLRR